MIIGFVGFIGCGKDTAADYLVNYYGFRRDSFANTLKDAVAAVFGWDRTLLEGRTSEAREWREQIDQWWADRLDIPYLTPRWVLQYWGTEVLRNNFHDDIWIASVENKLMKTKDNVVISDVRFPNEIKAIHDSNGLVIRIKRGPDPEWFQDAVNMNAGPTNMTWAISRQKMQELEIHSSETSWIGSPTDFEVNNDQNLNTLYSQLDFIVKNQGSDHLVAKVA
ncbi:MAG: hypothetical protein EBU90_12035 [Proteobacteria bacterium]|nr:hypothetical protein [Pseudomonadota bacterium]NBP14822.1 hypothetical protein [bacterium]